MKSLIRNVGRVIRHTPLLVGLYIPLLVAADLGTDFNSPKIRNQSQLEVRLAEEREKLKDKIGGKKIIAKLSPERYINQARKIGDNSYEIVISQEGANDASLKHELYHIADGHFENEGFFAYLFHDEPQAIIYAATGRKP